MVLDQRVVQRLEPTVGEVLEVQPADLGPERPRHRSHVEGELGAHVHNVTEGS